MEDGDKEGI
ncbi:Protein of unknown function [Bacillus mycoides]|nr:Protein of unknown function [Bacillus mycoides]